MQLERCQTITKKKYLHHFHQPPANSVEVSNNHLYQPLGKWAYPAYTLTHTYTYFWGEWLGGLRQCKRTDEGSWLTKHQKAQSDLIVCTGVSTPQKHHSPLSCQAPLKAANCPYPSPPLFLGNPPLLYRFFVTPLPKNQILQ